MPGVRVLLPAATALALLVGGPAAASTTLVAVEPANGATLARPPSRVALTFATDLEPGGASATVGAPGRQPSPARVTVDGPRLVVAVPAAGDGDYVLAYTVTAAGESGAERQVEGAVGFTVSADVEGADGEAPAAQGTGPWAVAGVLAVLGLAGVLLLTVRRLRGSR